VEYQSPSVAILGRTPSAQVKSQEPRLGAGPVLSFGSSEEVLAMVENQSVRDESLLSQDMPAAASPALPDVSAYAFSNEVLHELLALLIKSDQPTQLGQPAQLPIIAETPGTANPDPPVKPCPNVLQNRAFSQSVGGTSFPQSAATLSGTLSILTTPNVKSSGTSTGNEKGNFAELYSYRFFCLVLD